MQNAHGSLVDVPGVKIGHAADALKQTGCSVVLFEDGAVCGVDVRGAAPGTRETDLLNPTNLIDKVHAVVLSGGSAFGLDAASGVMQWLEQHKIGFDVGVTVVPIVPAAVLFDLTFGDPTVRPDAQMGYRAVNAASENPFPSGNTGAGVGATIGKMAGMEKAMKGGLGTASASGPDGLIVAAMVAVNAVGEIRDPHTGQTVAGACDTQGNLLDLQASVLNNRDSHFSAGTNTTIGIICCNAAFTKSQMQKVAQMAHDGLARTIYPVHTLSDGDTLFAATTGGVDASVNIVGMLAAEVMAAAVLDGVRAARSAHGVRGLAAS